MTKKPVCDDELMIVRLPQEDRLQAWIDNPPKPMPLMLSNTASKKPWEGAQRSIPINPKPAPSAHDDASKPTPNKRNPTRKERKPKPTRKGLVDMHVIAKSLNISPKEARGILRMKKVPKPICGWAFPPSEAENIKRIISDGKEELSKRPPKKRGRPSKKPDAKTSKILQRPVIPTGSDRPHKKKTKSKSSLVPLGKSKKKGKAKRN